MIELDDVTRVYQLGGEPFRALDGVTLQVQAGEFVAINGPSGSGKSTLANIIGGLDRPTSGTVVVNGQQLSGMKDGDLSGYRNRNIGFIFQSFNLQANATALENVTLPMLFSDIRRRARKERALSCLEAVGLADRAGQRANQLSGGQRQRVAIARALALEPASSSPTSRRGTSTARAARRSSSCSKSGTPKGRRCSSSPMTPASPPVHTASSKCATGS